MFSLFPNDLKNIVYSYLMPYPVSLLIDIKKLRKIVDNGVHTLEVQRSIGNNYILMDNLHTFNWTEPIDWILPFTGGFLIKGRIIGILINQGGCFPLSEYGIVINDRVYYNHRNKIYSGCGLKGTEFMDEKKVCDMTEDTMESFLSHVYYHTQ